MIGRLYQISFYQILDFLDGLMCLGIRSLT